MARRLSRAHLTYSRRHATTVPPEQASAGTIRFGSSWQLGETADVFTYLCSWGVERIDGYHCGVCRRALATHAQASEFAWHLVAACLWQPQRATAPKCNRLKVRCVACRNITPCEQRAPRPRARGFARIESRCEIYSSSR